MNKIFKVGVNSIFKKRLLCAQKGGYVRGQLKTFAIAGYTSKRRFFNVVISITVNAICFWLVLLNISYIPRLS